MIEKLGHHFLFMSSDVRRERSGKAHPNLTSKSAASITYVARNNEQQARQHNLLYNTVCSVSLPSYIGDVKTSHDNNLTILSVTIVIRLKL